MMRVLLLTSLLLTGARCKKDVFVYSTVGGDAVLPCMMSSDCSAISWTFFNKGMDVMFAHEVVNGKVKANSDKSSRMTFTSNCSISLRNLGVQDAGSYVCLRNDQPVTDVYLSILTITSLSTLTDLQPGGIVTLTCTFFTYYDAGSCKSYSKSVFDLRWVDEDGRKLPNNSRYNLTSHSRCNITLVTKLQKEDNNRKWRCLVNTTESSRAVFLDFRSAFLFQNHPDDGSLNPSVTAMCASPHTSPISRIVLCVALPIMVTIVAFFTWKQDRDRAKASAESFMLHEIN